MVTKRFLDNKKVPTLQKAAKLFMMSIEKDLL